MRDKLADRIPQENAPLDLAASKDVLNRIAEEMATEGFEASGIWHPGELIARLKKPAETPSFLCTVVSAFWRIGGQVTMHRSAGTPWNMKNEMNRPGSDLVQLSVKCPRYFGHDRSDGSILGLVLLMKA
jgi:hypothetical protein